MLQDSVTGAVTQVSLSHASGPSFDITLNGL